MPQQRLSILVVALALIFVFTFSTGNKDRTELENRTYVMAMSLDTVPDTPKKIKCSVEIVIWKELGIAGQPGSSSPNKPAWQPQGTDYSISGCLNDINWLNYRRLSLSHLESILIGEDYAKKYMKQLVAFAERSSEVQGKLQLAVTKGNAVDTLKAQPRIDKTVFTTISSIYDIKGIESDYYKLYLEQIASQILRDEPTFIPWVEEKQKDIELMGLGVFLKGKLAGFLNRDQVKGLSLLANKQNDGILQISYPGKEREAFKKAFRILDTKSTFHINEVDDKLIIGVDVWMEGNLLEDQPGVLMDQHLERTQQALQQKVRNYLDEAINLLYEYHSDLAGFDMYVERHKPWVYQKYKNGWDSALGKEIIVKVGHVDVRIRRVGMIS